MNEPLVHFIPWVRHGAGALPGRVIDAHGRRQVASSVQVSVTREAQALAHADLAGAPVALLGPGDVVGLVASQIRRRAPQATDHQLEPNYLALVEFERCDLPWMFSLSETIGDRLTPWLMLVVVPVKSAKIVTRPAALCPVLEVTDPAVLPNPAHAWAFAHGVVAAAARDQVPSALVDPASSMGRSRILCPTRLRDETSYIAAVVPTYEVGRAAGLGRNADTGEALWAPGITEIPVYDHWYFDTGLRGTFESLAEKLHPLSPDLAAGLGVRRVAVEPRAAALQAAHAADADLFEPGVHAVPTAISRPRGANGFLNPLSPDALEAATAAAPLHAALKRLLNIVAAADAVDAHPVVGPPLYGQWPAIVDSVDGHPETQDLETVPVGDALTWIRQLNADPGARAAAGAGADVVRHGQEDLMAEAWRQLQDLMEANRRIRWTRMSAAAMTPVHTQVCALPAEATLRLLAAAATRIVDGDVTTHARLLFSTVPVEATHGAFTRAARYATRAAGNPASVTTATVTAQALTALRDSDVRVLPPRMVDAALMTRQAVDHTAVRRVIDDLVLEIDDQQRIDALSAASDMSDRFPEIASGWADGAEGIVGGMTRQIHVGIGDVPELDQWLGDRSFTAAVKEDIIAAREHPERGISASTLDAVNTNLRAIGKAPLTALSPDHVSISFPKEGSGFWGESFGPQRRELRRPVLERSGAAAHTLLDGLRGSLGMTTPSPVELLDARGGELLADDVATLASMTATLMQTADRIGTALLLPETHRLEDAAIINLTDRVEPERAYGALLNWAHDFGGRAVRRHDDAGNVSPFNPAMASPRFPLPLANRLREVDPEWVLGGVGSLEPNSVCVLQVNRRFVEAALAGANHEMARELLWRHYPTDLRGTCFDRFWDGPDRDISPMDRWKGDLGTHALQQPPQDVIVVVIKADLVRRYHPIVTAVHGVVKNPFGEVPVFTPDMSRVARQVFKGRLGDDVTYVGLDMGFEEISEPDDGAGNGWFISLLEPCDKPRFGLDDHDPEDGPPPPNPPLTSGAGVMHYELTHDWTWDALPEPDITHLTPESLFTSNHEGLSNSAIMAASIFRIPFRLLLKAADFLAK